MRWLGPEAWLPKRVTITDHDAASIMAKSTAKDSGVNATSAPVDFVVITALEEERDAMLSKMRGARKLDKQATDIHTYYRASVRTNRRDGSEYRVVVTSLLNMGPINASAQAVSVVNRWKPKYVLLVGIACGVPGEVNYGDVLIATQVADYTPGKLIDGSRQVRWEVFPCGASLLDSANNVPANWERKIGVVRPKTDKVLRHKGVVASGGDVISDDQVIATYSESWPKLVGIEMEGGGVAAGVHQTTDRPEFLMIKSVSDFGKDKHDAEVKPWRHYACHAAAAFALSLIKSGPARSLSEVSETEKAASAEDDQRHAAERRWQYIQSHPIRGIEILFVLKGAVGVDWFMEVLDETRLTFSRDEKSFKLGQLLAASPAPNTKEHSRALHQPICSFWEIYEPEQGYWFKKIAPGKREFSIVAGFDAVAPWAMLGVDRVEKLEDLALLTEVGVSIPSHAYQIGVEEFILRFVGDTFSFSVRLSEEPLDALHELARTHHIIRSDKPMFFGTNFSGVQLLDMFLHQTLPRPKDKPFKGDAGIMGLSGPDGKAISFYPKMPIGFTKTSESKEYTFTVTTPAKFDSAGQIKKLEKKLTSNPADADLYFELASVYLYEGRLLDIVQCLETAIRKAPPSANVHGLMGQTLRRIGRLNEALAHCQAALVLAPGDARIHTQLGICLGEMSDHHAALVHFEAAARIEPSDAGHQSNLCMALVSLTRYSEALVPARRAVELAPDDSQSALRLGILLHDAGQREEALHFLEKATQLEPDSAAAHQQLGTHFATTDQHEKAVLSFQRAVEIEENPRRCELLGASLADLGRWSEAETAFRRGLTLAPSDAAMRSNLGIVVANLGRLEEAAELFEQLLQDHPDNVAAQQTLNELRDQMQVAGHSSAGG